MDRPIVDALVAGIAFFFFMFRFISGKKEKGESAGGKYPNYRTLFFIGITWLIIGIAAKIITFWGIGLVLILVGVTNKDKWDEEKKWRDLPSKERKIFFFC